MIMKVVLHPGYIFSKSDSNYHYISADQLKQLYGVRRDDIAVILRSDENSSRYDNKDWLHLAPLYSGNYYNIHEEKK